MKNCKLNISAVMIVFFSAFLHGQSDYKYENLLKSKLPNGILKIPEQGAPAALKAGGYILKITMGKLVTSPWDSINQKPKSMQDYVQKIRNLKTGDISYSSLNGGTLIAMSGKIRDLGKHYFYEFSGQKLEKPAKVWGKEERDSTGKGMPGAVENIKEGHCYLIETIGGKFALVRMLLKQERGAFVQWIYQPNGTSTFNIPASKLLVSSVLSNNTPKNKHKPLPGYAPNEIALQFIDPLSLQKALHSHMANREIIIQKLIKNLESGKYEDLGKGAAIRTLGKLRAVAAIPILLKMLTFKDNATPSRESSIQKMYPATEALINIGKPSSNACILQLEKSESDLVQKLLTYVIVKIEGTQIAHILLKNKSKGNVHLIDKVKNW